MPLYFILPLLNRLPTTRCLATRYCPTATSDRGCAGAEAVPNRKHFAKTAKPLRGRSERHGYVILVSNEPSCYNAATSERRHIRLKADYIYIALRGASIRRSQRGNSEAVFFRWYAPLTKWLLSLTYHLDRQARLASNKKAPYNYVK